jgi:hypothetical protein
MIVVNIYFVFYMDDETSLAALVTINSLIL